VFERRICSLGKSSEPFEIPRVPPVLRVVGSKKYVQIGIKRIGRQLHKKQWTVDGKRQQDNYV